MIIETHKGKGNLGRRCILLCLALGHTFLVHLDGSSWGIGTRRDNRGIFNLSVDNEQVLLVPAGVGTEGELFVLYFDQDGWKREVLPLPAGASVNSIEGRPGTDRIFYMAGTAPDDLEVNFTSLLKTSQTTWALGSQSNGTRIRRLSGDFC